ncbi:NAD-dependent protein deacylase [Neobacillus sp. YIM B02564]|uniref:protein acetyllysine N-acetyltransferase n=1 Tax=Neobacillus paridis TaxID=2803862 RepID=A0ABS1THZ0_9BACI|nr:NAD-dependent protein deacylase [Neobacillus paridis]MBL4950793.1 NAD-dependent protein deacylase [Neobacillus paridis]
MNSNLETCTDLIKNAQNIVVLTGAGISTESGIKDFRSETGIYSMAPEYLLSLDYFFRHPAEFYQFAIENLYYPDVKPNLGHEILTKWEKQGKVRQIITQNIDGLHQKAGSQNVIEFHGTIKDAACLHCGEVYSTEAMVNRMEEMQDFYICDHCKTKRVQERYIKPNVVLYGDAGEWFTAEGFETIIQLIEQADCLLVLGTSLKVTPFSTFPQYRRRGVPLVIINKGDTPYDNAAGAFVIHDSIGKTLNKIDKALSGLQNG